MTATPAHRRNQHCLPWQAAARVSIPLHSDVIVMGSLQTHSAMANVGPPSATLAQHRVNGSCLLGDLGDTTHPTSCKQHEQV